MVVVNEEEYIKLTSSTLIHGGRFLLRRLRAEDVIGSWFSSHLEINGTVGYTGRQMFR